MAESSLPWAGTVTGDFGPYSDDQWSDIWRKLFTLDRTTQGVLRNYLNELAATGGTSPVAINTGAALVDGKFYENTASVNVVIPTPAGATRVDRIVLRKDFAAQTVRITRVAGTEGAGVPAITQTDGTTWDLPLWQVSITIGGVITLTNDRAYARTPLRPPHIIYAEVVCFGPADNLETGDGKGYFHVPADLNGFNLVEVHGQTIVAGTGAGTTDIQVANVTKAVDMLSTKITIDSTETGSHTAATPAVIDTTKDDVATNDLLRIDNDALTAVPAKGEIVTLGFRSP